MTQIPRISTGIPGLDALVMGGVQPDRSYLIQGAAGLGKTTLGIQFLLEGRRLGEACLHVTLSESKAELLDVATSHGWLLDGITLLDVADASHELRREDQYTVFPPDEVELGETTDHIFEEWDRIQPLRVVIDALSDIRLLARDALRYRRQILGLRQFAMSRNCTVLLLDDQQANGHGLELHSLAHGVIEMRRLERAYGVPRRQLRVTKLRGSAVLEGYHDYAIRKGGLCVFPRLVPADLETPPEIEPLSSAVPELDQLMGGGLHFGTTCLLMGPPGTGKSLLATQYIWAACEQGLRGACFLFEERPEQFLRRAAASGRDLGPHVRSGRLSIHTLEPTRFSPGELEDRVRTEIEHEGIRILNIDSVNGYLLGMPDERSLILQLHELLDYLSTHGALTLLTIAEAGSVTDLASPVALSYLADTVIQLRYFETAGEVRQAISVIKSRDSLHERTIRPFQFNPRGLRVGEPLREFQGILTGNPGRNRSEEVLP